MLVSPVISALLAFVGGEHPQVLQELPSFTAEASVSSVRARVVAADLNLITLTNPGVRLNLFDDAQFDLTPRAVESRDADSFTWTGTLPGDDIGWFVLVREDDALIANVWTGDGRAFELRPDGRGHSVARQIEISALGDCECARAALPVQAPGPVAAPKRGQSPSCSDSIDVLMVHTAEARIAAGGLNAIHAIAHGSIAAANIACANSVIETRLRVAHIAEVQYTESHDFATDLLRLSTAGDGFLDDVQPLRNAAAADVVCLLVGSQASCGIAYVMSAPSPSFESSAFSVVNVGCAITSLSLPHEIGHNLGCQHINGDGSSGAYPFSFGHRFTGVSGQQWRTVMATGTGLRVPQFSNPDVHFDGIPTGIADGFPGAADNARTINLTSPIVAAFRTAPMSDCNANGVNDVCDIAGGSSDDANANGLPDECEGPPCAQPASAFLTSNTPQSFDNFGIAVSLSGDGSLLITGADSDDGAAVNAGAAFVHRRENGQWTLESELSAVNAAPFDRLGRSVAVSADGQFILVGAPFRDGFFPDEGAAFVFVHQNNQWIQQAALESNDGDWTDLLGIAVAVSADGSRAAIGAMADDDGGEQSGSVYIFDRSNNSWAQIAKLVADDASAGSEFGCAVAMTPDGTRVLIGARSDDALNTNFGAAYVFRFDAGRWMQEAKLVAEDAQSGDRLGGSVSINAAGSIALVGARGTNAGGEDSGAAYIFERQLTVWRQRAKLTAPDASPFSAFGSAVAISPNAQRAVIGSYLDRPRGPADVPSGSAYDFLRDGPAWRTTGKIAAPGRAGELAANDNFGLALAMAESSDTGMLAAIAAALDDLNTTVDAGSVRIIALDDLHPDCNTNSLPDECDIAHGISLDRNDDGVPDECAPIQPCPADVAPPPSGDNTVNIADVLRVISLWGRCAAPPATCPADLDGSGDVDIHDLLAVIAAWGECE